MLGDSPHWLGCGALKEHLPPKPNITHSQKKVKFTLRGLDKFAILAYISRMEVPYALCLLQHLPRNRRAYMRAGRRKAPHIPAGVDNPTASARDKAICAEACDAALLAARCLREKRRLAGERLRAGRARAIAARRLAATGETSPAHLQA